MLLLLKVGIRVSIKAFFIFYLIGKFILSDHVNCKKIYHCLFPTERSMRINETNSIQSIVLNFTHCASVRHESLSCNVSRRINLQKNEISFSLSEYLLIRIIISEFLIRLTFWYTNKLNLIRDEFLTMIIFFEWIQGFDVRSFS